MPSSSSAADPGSARASQTRAGRDRVEPGALTLAWADDYFARRLPGYAVSSIVKFPRGVSRETWLVDGALDGRRHGLVVRRDLAGGAVDPVPLVHEYEVYRRLGATRVPIAATLWFCDDPDDDPGGRPHYVREQVDGHWYIDGFTSPDPAFDELRVEAGREQVRKLALVHQVDWRAGGFDQVLPAPPSPEECGRFAVDRARRRIEQVQFLPFPIVTEAIGVLRRSAPGTAPAICLCKGTNGLGEEVWRDGEIVAMSDWELAALDSPAYDFAQCQDMLNEVRGADGTLVWGLEPALRYHEELTGMHVEAADVRWYQELYGLEMFAFAHHASYALCERGDLLARLAWVSTEVVSWSQLRLAMSVGVPLGGQEGSV